MEHTDGTVQFWVGQVGEKSGQIHRHHQALVNKGACMQTDDCIIRVCTYAQPGPSSGNEQAGIELLLAVCFALDEQMDKARHSGQGNGAQTVCIGRDIPPGKGVQSLANKFFAQDVLRLFCTLGLRRKHECTGGVERTQLHAAFILGNPAQEGVWFL